MSVEHKNSMTLALNNVVKHYNSLGENLTFNESELMIDSINNVPSGHPNFSLIKHGKYYFVPTTLPQYLRSPEIVEVVTNTCFARKGDSWELKNEYKDFPYLAPRSNPLLNQHSCVPLLPELVEFCLKRLEFRTKSLQELKVCKLTMIGSSIFESLEQCIENFLVSGRADRVCSDCGPTGCGPDDTCSTILKEHGKNIKTARILNGSFGVGSNPQAVGKFGRWRRVIID